jgi:hypothetical protein
VRERDSSRYPELEKTVDLNGSLSSRRKGTMLGTLASSSKTTKGARVRRSDGTDPGKALRNERRVSCAKIDTDRRSCGFCL